RHARVAARADLDGNAEPNGDARERQRHLHAVPAAEPPAGGRRQRDRDDGGTGGPRELQHAHLRLVARPPRAVGHDDEVFAGAVCLKETAYGADPAPRRRPAHEANPEGPCRLRRELGIAVPGDEDARAKSRGHVPHHEGQQDDPVVPAREDEALAARAPIEKSPGVDPADPQREIEQPQHETRQHPEPGYPQPRAPGPSAAECRGACGPARPRTVTSFGGCDHPLLAAIISYSAATAAIVDADP